MSRLKKSIKRRKTIAIFCSTLLTALAKTIKRSILKIDIIFEGAFIQETPLGENTATKMERKSHA